jgi:hypothetical protein
MPAAIAPAHHHHDDVLAASNLSIPLREQPGAAEPFAAADLVRIDQRFRQASSVIGQ